MASTSTPNAVNAFVSTARGLIVVQVLVAVIALAAGFFAIIKIREATDRTTIARAREQAAGEAQLAAQQQLKRSQDFAALLTEFTRAVDADDLRRAIDAVQTQINQAGGADARTYALLASAEYRAGNVLEAASAAQEAVRQNNAAIATLVSQNALGAGSSLNEQLYLDLAAYRCQAGAADTEVVEAVQSAPPAVRTVLAAADAAAVGDNTLLRRTDGRLPLCAQAVRGVLAEQGAQPVTSAADNLFAVRLIFFQAPPNFDPALRGELIRALPSNYQIPAVETISRDFTPGVRYYYPEQRAEAERIANLLRSHASGQQWSEANFGATQINGNGLPRDRLEVWLPSSTSAASEQMLTQLRVQYYRHVADGLVIQEVLTRRVPLANQRLRAPTLLNADQANMLACHPNLSGEPLSEFKALATALIRAGAPIRRIGSFRDPGAKPVNQVEIVASTQAPPRPLTLAQIDALSSCPAMLNGQ